VWLAAKYLLSRGGYQAVLKVVLLNLKKKAAILREA
jgi:hypothetical protein